MLSKCHPMHRPLSLRLCMASTCAWQALGVTAADATMTSINAAFKAKALKIHPDTSDKKPEVAALEFKNLMQARQEALKWLVGNERGEATGRSRVRDPPAGDRGPPIRDQAANFADMMSRRHEIFAGIQRAHQADTAEIEQRIRRWKPKRPSRQQREYAGYVELMTVSVRCDQQTRGVEIETWDLVVDTPAGGQERLIRERWFANGAWRSRIVQNTFSERSRVCRELYSGKTLSSFDRKVAEEMFGKVEVWREEIAWAIKSHGPEGWRKEPVW